MIFLLFLIVLPASIITQITQDEARPIDSALVAEYLDEGNFHTINYHGVTFPPGGYFTWDAGCGLYFVVFSNNEEVLVKNVLEQYYWLDAIT